MKTKTFVLTALALGCFSGPLLAQVDTAGNKQNKGNEINTEKNNMQESTVSAMPDLSTWPEASRKAAEEMISKYGKPDAAGSDLLAWNDKDHWKKIRVTRGETDHNFPVAHTDMMEQSVNYKVPPDKVDDLARFDGSVMVHRTQGLLSARCDKEANNILALNLSHDIITGKKTVEEARKAFSAIVKEKLNGGDPKYMKELIFDPKSNTAFADVNTTGLDKKGNRVAKQ